MGAEPDYEGLSAAKDLFEMAFMGREDSFAVTALAMALGMAHALQAKNAGALSSSDPRLGVSISVSAHTVAETARIILDGGK